MTILAADIASTDYYQASGRLFFIKKRYVIDISRFLQA
jgi:hypothetical protein